MTTPVSHRIDDSSPVEWALELIDPRARGNWDDPEILWIPAWQDLKFVMSVTDSWELTFTIGAADVITTRIAALHTDVAATRNGDRKFRGRVVSLRDTIADGKHSVQVSVRDYKYLIENMLLGNQQLLEQARGGGIDYLPEYGKLGRDFSVTYTARGWDTVADPTKEKLDKHTSTIFDLYGEEPSDGAIARVGNDFYKWVLDPSKNIPAITTTANVYTTDEAALFNEELIDLDPTLPWPQLDGD